VQFAKLRPREPRQSRLASQGVGFLIGESSISTDSLSSVVYFSTCAESPVRAWEDWGNESSSSATEHRVRGTGRQLTGHCWNFGAVAVGGAWVR
jgi:hypothetical protein